MTVFFFFFFFQQTKRRMLGNIQFIGELYKKSMLKENVMKTCVEHLLNATKELNGDRTLKGLKFISGDVDEDNLEVCVCARAYVNVSCVSCRMFASVSVDFLDSRRPR